MREARQGTALLHVIVCIVIYCIKTQYERPLHCYQIKMHLGTKLSQILKSIFNHSFHIQFAQNTIAPEQQSFQPLSYCPTVLSQSLFQMKTRTYQQTHIVPDQILEQKCSSGPFIKGSGEFKNYHKFIIISVIFSVFITYRLVHSQPVNKNCVVDNMHEWTFALNRWIATYCARPFIGLGQAIMDISITFMLIYWMLYVKNFRILLVAAFFQYGRQFMLVIPVTMPFEAYTVWYNPGFPTWTVEYGHTSDYFFSGHTGTIVLLYLQAKRLNLSNVIQYSLILSSIYIICMLLVARVHYTADVFTGLFFAGFCYEMTDSYLELLDMIINSPYRVFEIVKERVKRKLGQNVDQGTSLFDIVHE